MNKITTTSILSFIFLFISAVTTCLLALVDLYDAIFFLVAGLALLILSGIVFIFTKEKLIFNVVCSIVSAVALGFCIRAWYVFRGFNNPLWLMTLISVACVLYLLLFCLIARIPFIHVHINVFILVYLVLSVIIYILLIIFTKTTYVSTLGYYMLIEIAFIFALLKESNDFNSFLKNFTLSTYSVLLVAIIIATIMLDGDGFDILDLPERKKKQKNAH